ncbi:MAG: hypothetical protein U0232_26315 [Thermomicrobiales bacterium]
MTTHPASPPIAPTETEEVRPREQVRRGRRFLRLYLALLALATITFITLALLVRGQDALLRFDLPVERAIQGVTLPGYGWLLTRVSDFGYPPYTYLSYLVVFAALLLARQWRAALLGVGSSLLGWLLSGELRNLIERPRPSDTLVHVVRHIVGYGFPSGHVTQYVTLFGFCFYLLLTNWRGGLPAPSSSPSADSSSSWSAPPASTSVPTGPATPSVPTSSAASGSPPPSNSTSPSNATAAAP